jgi:hypothetical protein
MLKRTRTALWFWMHKGAYSEWRPKQTEWMKARGTVWAWFGGSNPTWRPVCDFCGGNCGQCGLTGDVGNVPFNFQRIVNNSGA